MNAARWPQCAVVLLLVLTLMPALVGCGGDEDPGAVIVPDTATTEESPTTAAPTTAAPGGDGSTATSLSSSETDLGDGRVRAGGFVKRAYEQGGQRRIDIDYADFLTGSAAEAAAAAAGDEFENDYYISNLNPRLRSFRVTAGTFELPQGQPDEPRHGDWAEFKEHVEQFPHTFWWIERRGDEVLLVEGQWVP
jgi:hypothetical protein